MVTGASIPMDTAAAAVEAPAADDGRADDAMGQRALEQRYDRLLAEHGAALLRVAATYEADPHRREDLFQDICLALWRALPSFRGDASERTYAFRIAHNRGLSYGWRRGRVSRAEGSPVDDETRPELLADRRSDPERETEDRQRRRRLLAAVRSLPAVPRQVVSLSLEGLSHGEIAEVLGVREGTVAVRLFRARKALKAALGGKEREGQ